MPSRSRHLPPFASLSCPASPTPRGRANRSGKAMGQFSGSEPLVGEIVGLRTFRVDESGLLLPLYST